MARECFVKWDNGESYKCSDANCTFSVNDSTNIYDPNLIYPVVGEWSILVEGEHTYTQWREVGTSDWQSSEKVVTFGYLLFLTPLGKQINLESIAQEISLNQARTTISVNSPYGGSPPIWALPTRTVFWPPLTVLNSSDQQVATRLRTAEKNAPLNLDPFEIQGNSTARVFIKRVFFNGVDQATGGDPQLVVIDGSNTFSRPITTPLSAIKFCSDECPPGTDCQCDHGDHICCFKQSADKKSFNLIKVVKK
ncbi:hypothetical protein A5482_012365 [Cyanobacterium sp. IPPAS B-1200]|uniref:hypothetical protein n=1 Tax=Cyanobacterium sp. IPPAS B-1200 TaxID=1562720 RepID=UPI00085266DC|nr:hypothetical protein [Cyanobacterium sp. IPPAS B-1200]OEJ77952.1 hypothetical protein A5482_03810 [Cyanobacterium sp. IPPAS B-1200]